MSKIESIEGEDGLRTGDEDEEVVYSQNKYSGVYTRRASLAECENADEAAQYVLEATAAYEAENTSDAFNRVVDQSASQRAYRSNMFRKLDKVFEDYEVFTPLQASVRCKNVKLSKVKSYLEQEVLRPISQIRRGPAPDSYMLIDPFRGEDR